MVSTQDRKILDVLRRDGRATIREISYLTGIRPSTVHQRIKRMKESGLIEKFTVKLNNDLAGESFIAFVLLSTTRDLDSSFLGNPHVREVFGVTGEYDILVKLKFRDASEFNSFLLDLRKNGAVKKSLSMIGTINLKEEL